MVRCLVVVSLVWLSVGWVVNAYVSPASSLLPLQRVPQQWKQTQRRMLLSKEEEEQNDVPTTTTTTFQEDKDFTVRSVSLSKPMGLVLEEIDETNPHSGVRVVQMTGAAALASQRNEIDLCLGDALVSIDGTPCHNWNFDNVMDRLQQLPDSSSLSKRIVLEFQRPHHLVAVRFQETGVAIAVPPKTPLRPLGLLAGASIPYSCNEGDCAVCEQQLQNSDNDASGGRFVRMCVARVPKGKPRITIAPNN